MVNVDEDGNDNEDGDDEVFPGEGLTWSQLGDIVDTDVDAGRTSKVMKSKEVSLFRERERERWLRGTRRILSRHVRQMMIKFYLHSRLWMIIRQKKNKNLLGQETHLAIETSGHGALRENHWLDDGAYLMVKILNKLASTRASVSGSKILTDLVKGLEEPAVAVEVRLRIDQKHADFKAGSFQEYGEAVLRSLEKTISSDPKMVKAPINYEGVRASGHGGWLLLRLSLHDPVLPLNMEASSHEEAVKLGLCVLEAVKGFPALDTSALTKFVGIVA